jgi:hypothetical protein
MPSSGTPCAWCVSCRIQIDSNLGLRCLVTTVSIRQCVIFRQAKVGWLSMEIPAWLGMLVSVVTTQCTQGLSALNNQRGELAICAGHCGVSGVNNLTS